MHSRRSSATGGFQQDISAILKVDFRTSWIFIGARLGHPAAGGDGRFLCFTDVDGRPVCAPDSARTRLYGHATPSVTRASRAARFRTTSAATSGANRNGSNWARWRDNSPRFGSKLNISNNAKARRDENRRYGSRPILRINSRSRLAWLRANQRIKRFSIAARPVLKLWISHGNG